MLYKHVDNLIPFVSFNGISFPNDVAKSNSGAGAKNLNDVYEILISTNVRRVNRWIAGFKTYNLKRPVE